MGKSDRFGDNSKSPQPGPAKYNIEGLTDKLLRENENKTKKTEMKKLREMYAMEGSNN